MSNMFSDALRLRYRGKGRSEAISALSQSYQGKTRNIERAVDAAYAMELKPLDAPITDPAKYAAMLQGKLSETKLADIVDAVELWLNVIMANETEWLTIHEFLRKYKQKGILYLILLLWTREAITNQNTVKLIKEHLCAMLGIPMQLNYDEKMDLATGRKAVTAFYTSLWLNGNIKKMVERQILKHSGKAWYVVNNRRYEDALTDESLKFKQMAAPVTAKDAERQTKRRARLGAATGKRGRPKGSKNKADHRAGRPKKQGSGNIIN